MRRKLGHQEGGEGGGKGGGNEEKEVNGCRGMSVREGFERRCKWVGREGEEVMRNTWGVCCWGGAAVGEGREER